MKVLSLFDGISCGRLALERAGIFVERYVAYEIDKNAIKISKKNYPQIEHCGDVTVAEFSQYQNFDLLIGGSPCQDLCGMGSREGLKGKKSGLFWEYVRALKESKPKWFLLENNASMKQADKQIITEALGVQPVLINSADFSAQKRKRLYWTNISIAKWARSNLTLGDIVQPIEEKIDFDITNRVEKYLSTLYDKRKISKTIYSGIKSLNEQSHTIGCHCATLGNNTNLIIYQKGRYYIVTPVEAERLQTLPDNYTAGVKNSARYFSIGNGWTVDVIAHILRSIPEEDR